MINYNFPVINVYCAINYLQKEKVIAYPTEAVFGLGCDPDSKKAVNHLLKIKKRSIKQGLILIAADYIQLSSYIDDTILTQSQRDIVFSMWPGAVTFTFPVKSSTPKWLTGEYNSLAVRVTNHPLAMKICRMFGKPLVSTSANFHGLPPCRTVKEVFLQFGYYFPIINGLTGNKQNPSEIRDALTNKLLRYG